jgi:hypothetical protein
MESMERGTRAPWVMRFHENSLRLKMNFWVEEERLVVEKLGMRRSALLDDGEEVWKILTNDMELNEEVAGKLLEKIPHLNSR